LKFVRHVFATAKKRQRHLTLAPELRIFLRSPGVKIATLKDSTRAGGFGLNSCKQQAVRFPSMIIAFLVKSSVFIKTVADIHWPKAI
jgi:hypothetical protein